MKKKSSCYGLRFGVMPQFWQNQQKKLDMFQFAKEVGN
jgi:hypothetical protein